MAPAPPRRENRSFDYSASTRPRYKSGYPLPSPPSKWDKSPSAQVVDDKKLSEGVRQRAVDDKLSTLRAYRRACSLCEKCAEKWVHGHRCGTQVQLHVLEELWDLCVADSESPLQSQTEGETSEAQVFMAISVAVVSGQDAPCTMRLAGAIQGNSLYFGGLWELTLICEFITCF